MMNGYSMKRWRMLAVLAACAVGGFDGVSSELPLIQQFGQAADIIVIGRSICFSKSEGRHYVSIIEVERVIAAVWDRHEIGRYLDLSDSPPKITIIQDGPVSDLTTIFMDYGRHLFWLKRKQLSVAEQKELGYPPAACYTPVKGRGGSRFPLVAHGVTMLSRLRDVVGEDEYERFWKSRGKDPEWNSEQERLADFGISAPDAVVETVARFAGLMVQGRDNAPELRRLSQSQDQVCARIASCLLEAGQGAQRFRFAADVEGDAGRNMVSMFADGVLVETNALQDVKLFTGSSLAVDAAYEKSMAVCEAIVVAQGWESPGAPGMSDVEDMRVMVITNIKGARSVIIPVSLSIRTWPPEKPKENAPRRGEKIIMFVGDKEYGASNQVVKVLAHTPENLEAVQAVRDRGKKIK